LVKKPEQISGTKYREYLDENTKYSRKTEIE
jgi:hypothetical protein